MRLRFYVFRLCSSRIPVVRLRMAGVSGSLQKKKRKKKTPVIYDWKKINETYFMRKSRISRRVKQCREQRVKYRVKVTKVIFVVLQFNDTIIHS